MRRRSKDFNNLPCWEDWNAAATGNDCSKTMNICSWLPRNIGLRRSVGPLTRTSRALMLHVATLMRSVRPLTRTSSDERRQSSAEVRHCRDEEHHDSATFRQSTDGALLLNVHIAHQIVQMPCADVENP